MAANENHKAHKPVAEFWDDLDDFETCMLVTRDGALLRSRPMAPHVRPHDGTIRFLTSDKTHKVDELEAHPEANVVFADDDDIWISVSGRIRLSRAMSDIDDLWSPAADAWLENGKREAIVLILDAERGEYWEQAGALAASWELAKAAVTGDRPGLGETGKVAL